MNKVVWKEGEEGRKKSRRMRRKIYLELDEGRLKVERRKEG